MIPGHTHPPAAPHSAAPAPSPLAAMLQRHAQAAPHMPMGHPGGAPMQPPGAPMPLNAGGHPAGRAGHMPSMIPGA